MADHITHDTIYDTVERDDFPAMLAIERYGGRAGAFDQIISATHDHFWDPMDPAYLDFGQPFDLANDYLMPPETAVELQTAVADRLDEGQKIRLVNENARWSISSILHGEQGALSLSANLCHILHDPGAQEYAANQVREEARHVTAFSRYVALRWGTPYPVGQGLGGLLVELVSALAAVVKPPPAKPKKPATPAVGVYPRQLKPGDTFRDSTSTGSASNGRSARLAGS